MSSYESFPVDMMEGVEVNGGTSVSEGAYVVKSIKIILSMINDDLCRLNSM